MSVRFVNITREEFLSQKCLYKYLPLEYALKTLDDRQIWFANPCSWKDPFEKRFIETEYRIGSSAVPFPWKGRVFCLCTTQTMISEAFWHTYAHDSIGILFRIRRQAFLEELDALAEKGVFDIYIGRVEYQKTDLIRGNISKNPFLNPLGNEIKDLNSNNLKVNLLLVKRMAFQYEDEIRIILVKKKKTEEKGVLVKYGIENADLISTVTIDPRAGEHVTQMLKKWFEIEYGFISEKSKRVLKSGIYSGDVPPEIKL